MIILLLLYCLAPVDCCVVLFLLDWCMFYVVSLEGLFIVAFFDVYRLVVFVFGNVCCFGFVCLYLEWCWGWFWLVKNVIVLFGCLLFTLMVCCLLLGIVLGVLACLLSCLFFWYCVLLLWAWVMCLITCVFVILVCWFSVDCF